MLYNENKSLNNIRALFFSFRDLYNPLYDEGGGYMGKILKTILKIILVTIIAGLAIWILKSVVNLFRRRRS